MKKGDRPILPGGNYTEASVSGLFSDVSPYTGPILDPLLESLPLRGITWQNFERLIAHLLRASDRNVSGAFRYGESGYTQCGIDILATLHLSKKIVVAQCKKVEKLARQDIEEWVAKFLKRTDLETIETVIFCVTDSIERSPKLVEAWRAAREKIFDHRIKEELWDFERINTLLRNQHELVSTFFNNEIADSFCIQTLQLDKYPSEFHENYKNRFGNHVRIENRSVSLDIFLPDTEGNSVSAGFAFARSDLRGVSFAVSRVVVGWLQWRAHSDSMQDCPFLIKLEQFDESVLQAPDVRLSLEPKEVEEFDWVLSEAWSEYIQAANTVEHEWRTLRFPRIDSMKNRYVFGLFRIRRWFWRMILKYANAHDYSHGDSDSFIFDGAPGVLKVRAHVGKPRAGPSVGHHLIAYGYTEGGITTPWDDDVVLGWEPLKYIGGRPVACTPSDAWNAEHAHNWLLNTLFPRVLSWVISQEEKEDRLNILWRLIGRKSSATRTRSLLTVKDFVVSLGSGKYSNSGLRLVDIGEAIDLVHTLQSHFSAYGTRVSIKKSLIINVLRLSSRLARQTAKLDEPYIRSRLNLGNGTIVAELDGLINTPEKIYTDPACLDMALRALTAIIRDSGNLPDVELDVVAELLSPLWERYREDIICQTYT